jgi:predicted extracellular nuclease
MLMSRYFCLLAAAVAMLLASRAEAAIRITEWMYSGDDGEFIEFTNTGDAAVDLTGWSFSDSARIPGAVALGSLGTIAAGESFLVTEPAAALFRTAWSLPASVKVLGGNSANLGRGDEINIYDATSALVDRLTYNDQTIAGSIRTQNASGNPKTLAALGTNNAVQWQLAVAGDAFGSYAGAAGTLGNPGSFTLVPEPATWGLAALAGAAIALRGRRTK